MVNVRVSVTNYIIGVLVKMIICGILVRVITGVVRHVKLTNKFLHIKDCSCKKRVFGKLVLAWHVKMRY